MIPVTATNIGKFRCQSRKQEQERQPTERGPKLVGDADGVIKSIVRLLRPEDVRTLALVEEVRVSPLSGRGGDIVSGRRKGKITIVFNKKKLGTHHPILWAALLVRELPIVGRTAQGLPVTRSTFSQGVSRAVQFLNQLPSRLSLDFLEEKIADGSKDVVKQRVRLK